MLDAWSWERLTEMARWWHKFELVNVHYIPKQPGGLFIHALSQYPRSIR